MKIMRWLNAGFLILAACRALVPGLCATQLAVGDAAACHAAHSCCEAKADSSEPALCAPLPTRPACGFCALMHGMLDPLERAQIVSPAAHIHASPIYMARVVLPAIPASHQGRAPPISG